MVAESIIFKIHHQKTYLRPIKVNQDIYSMNELRNSAIGKEIPENKNPNKITNIVENSKY